MRFLGALVLFCAGESFLSSQAWAELDCETMTLASYGQESGKQVGERLQAFIAEQIETGRLTFQEVEAVLSGEVNLGASMNSILAERTLRQMLSTISRAEQTALLSWLEGTKGDSARQRESVALTSFYSRMRFHHLDFNIHSFELMDTSVTREMWWVVMGTEPQDDVDFKPDSRPVTSVHPSEVEDFVSRLNVKLDSRDGQVLDLVEGHQPGLVYRLPNVDDFKLIRKEILRHYGGLMRITSGITADILSSRKLAHFGWFVEGSQGADHPQNVGTKNPMLLQNRPFFDLLGNASEMFVGSEDYKVWGGHIRSLDTAFQYLGARWGRTEPVEEDVYPPALRIGAASFDRRHPLVGFRLVRARSEK